MLSKNYIKIIIVGDSGVGKTSILNRYIKKEFSQIYKSTIGADFFIKDITYSDQNIKLQLWDTAGNEKFHSIGTSFYRNTDICIMVFDVTNNKSFYNLQNWYDEFLLMRIPENVENFPFILLGNKTDLVDNSTIEISEKQINQFCKLKNIKYYECCAKNNNIDIEFILDEFLMNLSKEILKNNKLYSDNINLIEKSNDKNKCCIII